MKLYLLRHGEAMDHAKWKGPDHMRPLIEEGRKTTRKVAKGLKKLGLNFDHIISSPYVRARDTALLVAEVMKYKLRVDLTAELVPSATPDKFMDSLGHAFAKDTHLLAVSHEPFLSALVSNLLGSPAGVPMDFKKSGLCRIDLVRGAKGYRGTLKWFLSPKLLKK